MSKQNIEFSSDENCLIVKSGKLEGEYQAKTDGDLCTGCGFWAGDFFGGCRMGGMLKGHCAPTTRKDGQTIIWIKKENTEMSQKFKLSDDQNTLVVVGGEFEGQYEATGQDGCASCSFLINEVCELKTFSTCAWGYRKDSESIIWMKKETEMTKAPAPAPTAERFSREAILARLQHRHFDLIVQWAKNPTRPVWMWSGDTWEKIAQPSWTSKHYVIGEKPTMPPVKMVKYDGGSIEFPEPAKVKPERYKDYWAATIYGVNHERWTDHSTDIELLENGLIQLTKEGAEKQSEALVELLKNHAQKWG